jgi:hypothetical protein
LRLLRGFCQGGRFHTKNWKRSTLASPLTRASQQAYLWLDGEMVLSFNLMNAYWPKWSGKS